MSNPAGEATTQLFKQYGDEIYRYALFVLGNPDDAKDVVQEVFTRVFHSIDSFRHNSNARTWIWTITRNYLSDTRRRRKWQTISLDENVSLKSLPSVQMSLLSEWEDVLNTLSLPHRQVIYWRIIEDLSVTDTANLLGWTNMKVRVTLHRAINRLQKVLPKESILQEKGSEHHGL